MVYAASLCCRWDRETYPDRSVEDLKERYYSIANTLAKVSNAACCSNYQLLADESYSRGQCWFQCVKVLCVKYFIHVRSSCGYRRKLCLRSKLTTLITRGGGKTNSISSSTEPRNRCLCTRNNRLYTSRLQFRNPADNTLLPYVCVCTS